MKGWVYVITNLAMPGLVKVGYSRKDPELRAAELNSTGTPHPFVVEYEVLLENPYLVEQKTHRYLRTELEGKEWFRCSPEHAIAAIKHVAADNIIIESFKKADRLESEKLVRERKELARAKELEQTKTREKENLRAEYAKAIENRYSFKLDSKFPKRPFWNYWLSGSILVFIGAVILAPDANEDGIFILTAILGAIFGFILQEFIENSKRNSAKYKSILENKRAELEKLSPPQIENTPKGNSTSTSISPELKKKLSKWVGNTTSEAEIESLTKMVERIVDGKLSPYNCRKIVVATKLNIEVKAPKDILIRTILNSYPREIDEKIATIIVDELVTN